VRDRSFQVEFEHTKFSQGRRDKKAAKKFFRKLLKGLQYVPNVIITDKEIRRGEGRSVAECRSLPRQVAEQPRREFASANEVEGARDETVQVSRARPTLSLNLRSHRIVLPCGETAVQS